MALGPGQIIGGTAEMLGKRFLPLLGMWLLYFALSIAATIMFFLVVGMSSFTSLAVSGGDNLGALSGGLAVFTILFYIGYLLLWVAQVASMTALTSPVQEVLFGQAFFAGVRSAPTLGLVSLVLIIFGIIAMFVLTLVIGLMSAGAGLSGLGALAIILIPAAYFWSRMCLIVPIAAVERTLNPITVVARSWRLTSDHWRGIFIASLLFALLLIAGGILLFWPAWGIFDGSSAGSAIGLFLYSLAAFAIYGIVASMAQAAFVAVIHGEITGTADANLQETFA